MLDKYKYLNNCLNKFLTNELRKIMDDKYLSKKIFDRCYKEMNLLYDKGYYL